MLSVATFKNVWSFRHFILGSIKREFQSRYRETQLGILWLFAHPLATIGVYTLLFAELMKSSLPGYGSKFAYSIYLCAGVLTWGLFSEMLTRTVNIFVANASLLKKMSFPKLCLPIIVVGSALLNFAIVMAVFLVYLIIMEQLPGLWLLALLPVLAIQIAFAMGLGVLLATINVFYRDVNQSMGILLQFWFWLTPIVYPANVVPDFVRTFLEWNPVWPLINAYHGLFLDGALPDWSTLVYPGGLALLFVFLGMFAFARLQGEIVDEL